MEIAIGILLLTCILLWLRIGKLLDENQILTALNKYRSEQLDIQDELIKKMLEDENNT